MTRAMLPDDAVKFQSDPVQVAIALKARTAAERTLYLIQNHEELHDEILELCEDVITTIFDIDFDNEDEPRFDNILSAVEHQLWEEGYKALAILLLEEILKPHKEGE